MTRAEKKELQRLMRPTRLYGQQWKRLQELKAKAGGRKARADFPERALDATR